MKIIITEQQFRYILNEFEYSDALRLEKAALDYYGETYIPKLAGYITPRGHLLDFSGGSGTRASDHREIGYLLDELGIDLEKYNTPEWEYSNSKYMYAVMDMGFIRVMPETQGFDMSVMPTQEQFQVLRKLIERYNGNVIIDVGDDIGAEYELRTPVDHIISDIKAYYIRGLKPEPYVSSEYE